MYCKTFAFSSALNGYDHLVKPDELYNDETGYGFYTEEELKEMGYSDDDISDMKSLKLHDEIILH